MKQFFGQRITILLLITFSICSTLSAQKIEIRSDSLFINSKRLTKLTTSKEMQEILGKANRMAKLESTILTYDSLGLKIYLNPKTLLVESVDFDFVKGELDFSPKSIFHGTFTINGKRIPGTASIQELTQIKEIAFHHSVLDLYTGTTTDLTLTFQISDNTHHLEEIAVAFKTPE